jgi:hypothetical protein
MTTGDYERWAGDGPALAAIGQVLAALPFDSNETAEFISVRLPKGLAQDSVDSWNRDESDSDLGVEGGVRRVVRHRSAVLALIGLCVDERGLDLGDEVHVDISRRLASSAIVAANIDVEDAAAYDDAIRVLLADVPELEPAWADLLEWMEADEPYEVGIYSVVGQLVAQLLVYCLTSDDDTNAFVEFKGVLPTQSDRGLQGQEFWEWLPDRGTPAAHDVANRVIGVLESWAGSPSRSVRGVVYIDFLDFGWHHLSREIFLERGGPAMRNLVAEMSSTEMKREG